jgi:hypothetical protein
MSTSAINFKASSSPYYVFRDGFNIYMLGGTLFSVVLSIVIIIIAKSMELTILVGGCCIFPLVAFFFYYLWANLTRSIEISDEALRYREGHRRLMIRWQEIESAKVDLAYQNRDFLFFGVRILTIQVNNKEITLLVKGKVIRLHLFGLKLDDAYQVGDVLTRILSDQNIEFEYQR